MKRLIAATSILLIWSVFLGCKKDGNNPVAPVAPHRELLVSLAGNNIGIVWDDGTNRREWTPPPQPASGPRVSPDGNYIAYYSSDTTSDIAVYVMKVDGSERRRVAPVVPQGRAFVADLQWTKDSRTILFSSPIVGYFQAYSVDRDGQNVKRISPGGLALLPHPSPLLPEFTYWGLYHGVESYYIMDIQGIGTPRPIIAAKPAGAACWSPDGNRIACAVNFADTVSPDVYVVNRDGSDAIVLTSDHSSCPVEWSPDGARILFMRWNGAKYVSLHLMDADGSHSVRLADMSPVEIYSAHFSPDGARIAFEAFRPEGFPMDIYVMNRDGSNLSKILENTFSDFDWMPMN